MTNMKAVRIHEYGGPDVLRYEDAPKPEAGADEVLIRVQACAINQIDWKIRFGYLRQFYNYHLPVILGWDISGIVEAVGADVAGFNVGDEVYSFPDKARNGGYADYIAVKASEVALKPRSIDHIHAAAVPIAALVVWQSLFEVANLQAGQSVLIQGAAGGVGTFAVQLARWKGAHIIATASSRNHDYLQRLGADEVIDYNTTQFEDVVKNIDVVFDAVGSETQPRSWQVLKEGGMLVSTEPLVDNDRESGVFVVAQPNGGQLTKVAALIDEGAIKPVVSTVLPLRDVAKAHELNQTGHTRGKIVLDVA